MAKRQTRIGRMRATLRGEWQFAVLCVLLVAVFAMGGGSRGDILSLIVLRPLAVICLALGLAGLTRAHWAAYRLPLGIMGAILALIALHLVPLPPFLWTNLPGRELAVEAGELVGLQGIWRPLSLVPYRGWNALYAMLVPAAAMVLAVQVSPDRHRTVLALVLVLAGVAALLGIAQAASGFSPALHLYRVTNALEPTGLFANRNHFAALLCIALPMLALVASRASESNRTMARVVCAGGALVALLLILATGSRGGLILAVIGILTGWLIWTGKPGQVRRRRVGRTWIAPAFGLAAAVFAVVCLAVIFQQADALDRLTATDAVEENRFAVWQVILANLGGYMPLGSGIGSFVEIFKIHEPADMLGLNYWNHAHNDWLEWVLEGGIPVAILLLVIVAAWAIKTRGLIAKLYSGRHSIQLGVLGAGIILILGLWSLVDYPLRVPSLACLTALAAVWMTLPVTAKAPSERTR